MLKRFQDIGGKMVIGICFSMLGTYVCLFINTFDEGSTIGNISKTNPNCIAIGKTMNVLTKLTKKVVVQEITFYISACLLYFFTLSSFSWLSAMSYNIMTQFK